MKIDPTELAALLKKPNEAAAADKASLEALPSAQAPARESTVAEPSETGTPQRYTPLHKDVAGALPRLWAKATTQAKTRTEHRRKLRELLAWLLKKKGFVVRVLAPMPYAAGAERIEGKIDLTAHTPDARPVLAIEADWTLQESSLHKLASAHKQGYPVLWVVGSPASTRDEAREIRRFAINALGRASGDWLLIFHLEQGWI